MHTMILILLKSMNTLLQIREFMGRSRSNMRSKCSTIPLSAVTASSFSNKVKTTSSKRPSTVTGLDYTVEDWTGALTPKMFSVLSNKTHLPMELCRNPAAFPLATVSQRKYLTWPTVRAMAFPPICYSVR